LHYAVNQTKPLEATVRYRIDGKGSKFIVRAFATGLLSAFGHNPTISIEDFEGEAQINPDALEESSVHILIHAESLAVTDDVSNKDRDEIQRRMHQEVLESDGYPEIEYQCSKVSASKTGEGQYWVALNGELSLHGVTRTLPVSARVTMNGNVLRATGDFSVKQSDFDLKAVSAAGGTVKLKDEIKLSFDITARRQD
jgi:polyisoprenoid-binding protein YceI